jgi:F-type H+-transporting ATPase subunit delta
VPACDPPSAKPQAAENEIAIMNEVELESAGNVDALRVARVYAEALLNAAEERHQDQEMLDELQALHQYVLSHPDPKLRAFFISGVISRDRAAIAIRDAFRGRASDLLLNFLLVLNDHLRLNLVRPIIAEYRELYNERANRLRVLVRTAVPLPDDQRQRLEQQLREQYQKDPVLDIKVEPDLLGGLVVRVGDWVYDASVRTRLDTLLNQITESSSHEIQSRRDRFSSGTGN